MKIPVVDYDRLERLKISNEIIPFNTITLIYLAIFLVAGLVLFKRYQDKNQPIVFSNW